MHDRVPSIDGAYMTKHDVISRAVQEYDDEHASDEFAWKDRYEPPRSPTSEAIINALMMAYPDKF